MERKLPLLILLLAIGAASFAQSSVARVPVYEVFTSSTCPPCKPANDHLVPEFEEREEEIVVVMYHMSWPGTGDPYYTPEGNGRRGIYSVNSIPYFVRNGQATAYSSFDVDDIDDDLAEEAPVKMELRYMLNPDSQSISLRARAEVLDTLDAGAHRMIIALLERETDNNVKSNGETEFHWVFKKMLPTSSGDFIIGEAMPGDTFLYDTTYVFQGDYRLPNDANDPINDNIEHSVEEFEDLQVVMFMQSAASDQTIYQGARGELSVSEENYQRPWGAYTVGTEELVDAQPWSVYPNPVLSSVAYLKAGPTAEDLEIQAHDITGREIAVATSRTASGYKLHFGNAPTGLVLLSVKGNDRSEVLKLLLHNGW